MTAKLRSVKGYLVNDNGHFYLRLYNPATPSILILQHERGATVLEDGNDAEGKNGPAGPPNTTGKKDSAPPPVKERQDAIGISETELEDATQEGQPDRYPEDV
jgi:hypothetical protein